MKEAIRGIMMGCLLINVFLGLMILEPWAAGLVPNHLPLLIIASGACCFYGWHINREDDDES